MYLDERLHSEIVKLSDEGNALCDTKEYQRAKDKFILALDLVPNPKTDWEAATWLYVALGDVSFLLQSFDEAKDYMFDALNCPDSLDNPFIMLRLGQSLFEIGEDMDRAKDFLMKAYMLGGNDIFDGEDEKYFEMIRDIAEGVR